jgi:hypothetical protein
MLTADERRWRTSERRHSGRVFRSTKFDANIQQLCPPDGLATGNRCASFIQQSRPPGRYETRKDSAALTL